MYFFDNFEIHLFHNENCLSPRMKNYEFITVFSFDKYLKYTKNRMEKIGQNILTTRLAFQLKMLKRRLHSSVVYTMK